jgi:phosphate:Na+ symporter
MENTLDPINTLEIGTILMGLFGGLALFLFGMDQLTHALKKAAGGRMKALLARLTTNRFKATFAGTLVTAVVQSSSVTTVLVVGFISAGLMTLTQSVGVIMGANIGTTITAQIIAFNVTQYALILVALGFAVQSLIKRKQARYYGLGLMGLGMIFFGMELMTEATTPLRTYQPFVDLMRQMDNPALGLLVSAAFTAVVQSSSATTGVIIVLASQGFISLDAGIALVFGANIGTCVTAFLAAIGKPREAVQAATVHILFQIIGVIIWFGFIDQLAEVVRVISPLATGLSGTERLAAETPRQIANAHTIFNIANTMLLIWFVTPIVWFVRKIIPIQPVPETLQLQPKHLNEIFLDTPALALDSVRMELARLGTYTLGMVREALPVLFNGTEDELRELARMDDNVDSLHVGIVAYLGELSQQSLSKKQSKQLHNYLTIGNHIESIGDLIQTNFVESGISRLRHEVEMSETTQEVLTSLHEKVCWAIEQSLEALTADDKRLAKKVQAAKSEINRLADEAEIHLGNRLIAAEPNRMAAFRIETEIIEYLRRIYYFAKRSNRLAFQS